MEERTSAYLFKYRRTPHNVTGVTPAELMFKRKLRTKLSTVTEYVYEDSEIRDRDSESKEKGKLYAHKRRIAQYSELKPGHKVLVKGKYENKLSTGFNPKSVTTVEKTGNSVVVESNEGFQSCKHTTHVKNFSERHC